MKKILSLDGGGIKGVFTLGVLSKFEEFVDNPIYKYFDLIVGTSTGGIIALGLGKGFTANELLNFYTDLGKKIFSGNKILNKIRHVGISKYSNFELRKSLEEKFGDTLLGESKIRLVIPSQVLENGNVHLYKTAHNERFREDYKVKMADVALATSAATSYFPSFKSNNGLLLIDGGTYANNPIAIAAVEAVGILKWEMNDIHILSIGCTNEPLDIKLGKRFSLGLSYWAFKILDLIMKGQSSVAEGMAKHLSNYNIVRIDEIVSKNKFKLDSTKVIEDLKGLGEEIGRNKFQDVEYFFTEIVEEFDPIYKIS